MTMELRQTMNPDRPARYYADGKRITKAEYDRLFNKANLHGHADCFATKCRQLPGGKFQRTNYVSVRFER
jgi:hypothetical protein